MKAPPPKKTPKKPGSHSWLGTPSSLISNQSPCPNDSSFLQMDAHLSIFLQHPNWSGLDYCNDLLMTLSPLVSFPLFFSLNHSHSDHTKCTSQIIFPCLNNSYNFKIKYEFFKNGAMANFMCQVGWAIGYPCIWLNILGVCVGYFWMRWTSEPADWIAAPLPNMRGLHPISWKSE